MGVHQIGESPYLPPDTDGRSAVMDVPEESTIREVIGYLKIPTEVSHIAMVNGKHSPRDTKLREGDVVSMFTPIGGG